MITGSVAQQTVKKGASALPTALPYADAWTVEGMVNGETKADLGGTLAINTTEGSDPAANVVDFYDTGIKLTITNTNYTLKAGTQYGTLRVIDAASTIELDPTNAELAELIEANKYVPADDNLYDVTFAHKALKANTWYTMVLPFEVTVAELSRLLGYAIVNVIDPTRTEVSGTGSKFYGKLTMKGANDKEYIPANTPFMVKTADDITGIVDFGKQTIVASTNLTVDAGANVEFTGTYKAKTVSKDDDAAIWFLMGNYTNWAFIKSTSLATWDILPFEGFIDMSNLPANAREITFFMEEEDGTVTAIKSVDAEDAESAESAAEGWYTINGIKLNAKPTQKGIYIFNGKKVAIQ